MIEQAPDGLKSKLREQHVLERQRDKERLQ